MFILDTLRAIKYNAKLPQTAKEAKKRDAVHVNDLFDIDERLALDVVCSWLLKAQSDNKLNDNGYARHFSFVNGWASSYPETTGYIIPTLIEASHQLQRPDLNDSALKALDWLVAIQFDDGSFQGGRIDSTPVVPVTFNTGQILLGLAAGLSEYGDRYSVATHKAAQWLCDSLDDDGCWRKFPTPFAANGEKAYETHVAWGLMEAAKSTGNTTYLEYALKNVDWALTKQQANGWFVDCCLEDPTNPLTHTIGYVLRGVVEAYLHSKDDKYYQAALITAKPLTSLLIKDSFLPGRLNKDWQGTVDWSCLTGSVQIASCLLLLNDVSPNPEFVKAALQAITFVRKTIKIEEDKAYSGGVQGSYPVQGGYGRYQQLNWAAKFYIDAQLLALEIK
ncbi:prenyltransferase/squalene oxidase repeat-containing protein [Colwellia psychrerythraea]|uniref:Squalene cyclase C-terminal domain-containing protein n=1 Tax=Colwellia psychrerythraea (strain 34H / ATCC BAA-681) TaxID=167879 RepID=Q47U78_COLP3|nr:prenyltransferase/squalene oxidase repeat-containing protein [Colwellia psychrerythraea]AAZ25057.1 hypothetical protein CPS_5006 [Colwellia psychrerythraea 34H]